VPRFEPSFHLHVSSGFGPLPSHAFPPGRPVLSPLSLTMPSVRNCLTVIDHPTSPPHFFHPNFCFGLLYGAWCFPPFWPLSIQTLVFGEPHLCHLALPPEFPDLPPSFRFLWISFLEELWRCRLKRSPSLLVSSIYSPCFFNPHPPPTIAILSTRRSSASAAFFFR